MLGIEHPGLWYGDSLISELCWSTAIGLGIIQASDFSFSLFFQAKNGMKEGIQGELHFSSHTQQMLSRDQTVLPHLFI